MSKLKLVEAFEPLAIIDILCSNADASEGCLLMV
ncbi:hypothetical protein VISP3789_08098 [Vibrio splendidus ATCC 33789]|nr:hypothetical protein VISP3789_08098 [Vibrio splendidus ATCC 33789]